MRAARVCVSSSVTFEAKENESTNMSLLPGIMNISTSVQPINIGCYCFVARLYSRAKWCVTILHKLCFDWFIASPEV